MKSLGRKINYCWRLFATGLAFSTFGLSGLLMGLTYIPIVLLVVRDKARSKNIIRNSVSFCFRMFFYYMHYLGLLKFETINLAALREERSVLLIANHPTLIDVVAIIGFCPNPCCIVKEALWENVFMHRVIEAAGFIPNSEPEALLARAKQAIKEGDVLVLFPEGTRTKPGEKPVFQRGAAHVALSLGCPVRCIRITCEPLTLSKGIPWYRIPPQRVNFTMKVEDRIYPERIVAPEARRPLAARQLTRAFYNHYCS